jgi:hypothetical protein
MRADQNILDIQEYMGIDQTGTLDNNTIRALRAAERELNRRTNDHQFSGAFVVPEAGYVVDFDDLKEAYRRIQKY